MTNCNLCESKEYSIVYSGVIRDGVFGTESQNKYKVVKCNGCGLVRLLNNQLTIDYYQSDEYRNSYNETSEVSDYVQMHNNEQPPRLQKISASKFRDKVVLDYGCGGGSFLDLVYGLSNRTIGIEPFKGYHNSLIKRGHQVFSSAKNALNDYRGKVDIIVSFGVLEHVEYPTQYLKDAFKLLKTGGVMYLETNNLDDIIMKLDTTACNKFFFRTAHLWYFDRKTLKKISKLSGFSNIKISFRQNFDLSNTMMWLRDKKPSGNGKIGFLDKKVNDCWISFLESKGLADLVCIEMKKK